jgi:hypothetical protein
LLFAEVAIDSQSWIDSVADKGILGVIIVVSIIASCWLVPKLLDFFTNRQTQFSVMMKEQSKQNETLFCELAKRYDDAEDRRAKQFLETLDTIAQRHDDREKHSNEVIEKLASVVNSLSLTCQAAHNSR